VKRKSIFLVITIFIFLCSEFTQYIYGNPVVVEPRENPFIRIPMLITMFFIGAALEYAYFSSKFSKNCKFDYVSRSDYKLFLKINLVTFPLTQILAYFFYIYFLQFFWVYILLIEIGVVLIESYLLRFELQRVVDVEISSKFILGRTFIANIISFLVGFLAYLNYISIFIL
jgi:hypothetical protein